MPYESMKAFLVSWKHETEATEKVFAALTDASLSQAVGPDDRTLGRIAWHIAFTIPEMMSLTGLPLAHLPEKPPAKASAILDAYRAANAAFVKEVTARWTDADLSVEDPMYGERWPRGMTLAGLVHHQVHHRGQMTVLMRQAGLRVPGIYGPAREDWPSMGMKAPEV